jgi:glycosyltransferase involved in cell wall biosynthesis
VLFYIRPFVVRKVKIINKDTITNSEINEVIRESHAVFRLDKEVTQSGVLPLAYMNKTPIIARDIQGLTQHVKHKKNGYIVPLDCSVDDLVDAMEFIKDNFERMSENARKSYEEKWSGQNWDSYYSWLT